MIDKYEPVNPQSLVEELKNLQKAFEDSQNKLTTDVKYLKDQVESFAHDLTRESIKREQETKMLTGKLADGTNWQESSQECNRAGQIFSHRSVYYYRDGRNCWGNPVFSILFIVNKVGHDYDIDKITQMFTALIMNALCRGHY